MPRFRPWTEAAIAALAGRALPAGPVLVPCCGPGQELAPAADATGRAVWACDLSPAMVARARALAADRADLVAEVADAQALPPWFVGVAAGVLSCFGLQQLPAPDAALEGWARTLAPGGVLSVMFWPRGDDDDGPSVLLRSLLARRLPAGDVSWQERLVDRVHAAGAELLVDERVAFTMHHESAGALFDALTRWGPGRVQVVRHGQAFVDALRPEFVAALGDGPIAQRAVARHLVARRPSVRDR